MISKIQWSILNVFVSIIIIHEHCIKLFEHVRHFRHHLININQKIIFKQKCLKFFQSFEKMIEKFFASSKIKKMHERMFQKITYTRQIIFQIIVFEKIASKKTKNLLNKFFKKFENFEIFELKIVIKHFFKFVNERYKKMKIKNIFKKINCNVNKNSNIQMFSTNTNTSFDSWTFKTIIFRHLRNDDVLISIRKNENKTLFNRITKWFKMFEFEIKMQNEIFEILMHVVKIKNFQLKNDKIVDVVQIFVVQNATKFEHFQNHKNIIYIAWLKKFQKKIIDQTNLIIEFVFFFQTNETIRKKLILNEKTHTCEKLIRNMKIKQCYNCWNYDHIENQCRSNIKCNNCANIEHKTNVCTLFKSKTKCIQCSKNHNFTNNYYAIKKKK